MIAGHFGFAAAVKSRERAAPTWALMLATVWLDIVFVPLLAMKIEGFTPAADATRKYGGLIIHADYTHSIVGALLLAVIFGVCAAMAWSKRVGMVLGAVVFSHWALDLLVHRADMPVLPANYGDLPKLGFGLWRFPVATAVIELLFVVAGAVLYWRAAREVAGTEKRGRADLAGTLVLVFGVAVLVLDFTGVLG